MLRLIRTNQPLIVIPLLVYAFVLRAFQFWNPAIWTKDNASIWGDFVMNLMADQIVLSSTIALLLVVSQGVIINTIVNQYKMTQEITYYPALFYILLASAIPEFLYLSPVLLSITFYMIALYELFKWYKNYEASAQIFNVGFWLAIGSFFYFPISVFFLLGILGLNIFRKISINGFLVLTIGFLVPYFLMGLYFFWNDGLAPFLENQVYQHFNFLNFQIPNDFYTYIKFGFFTILIVWAIAQSQKHFFRTSIQNQKITSLMYWSFGITIIGFLFQQNISLETLMLFAVPLSYFVSANLLMMKKAMWAEVIHGLLLLFVIALQYKEHVIGFFTL